MNRNKIWILILLFINVIVCLNSFLERKKMKELVEISSFCNNELTRKYAELEYFELISASQNNSWNKPLKESSIDYEFDNSTYLCLRISLRMCGKCIEEELKNLNMLKKHIGADKIVLIVDFISEQQKKIFTNNNNIQFKLLEYKNITLEMEKLNTPYYFLIVNNRIQYPFIPLKQKPELAMSYFNNISSFFQ